MGCEGLWLFDLAITQVRWWEKDERRSCTRMKRLRIWLGAWVLRRCA